MSGEWPRDPSDPRCPNCGEPVSATASYCMHCEADLPPAGFGEAETTTGGADDVPLGEADPGMSTSDDDTGPDADEGGGWGTDATAGSGFGGGSRARDARERAEKRAEEAAAWIDPDSLLDNVSTVVVGVVTAVVTLVVGMLLAYGTLPPVLDPAAPWLALAGTAGAGLWVGRTPSVFGAARKAGLVVGAQIALFPLMLAVGMPWETAGDAVGGFVIFAIFFWPVAGIVAGVGWVLGMGGVDDEV